MKQIELSEELTAGSHELKLIDRTATSPSFQVDFRYHVPTAPSSDKTGSLAIELTYDQTELKVDETVTAQVKVMNQSGADLPMVLLELPIPAGFEVEPQLLQKLVDQQQIAKFQLTPRNAQIYLRSLGEPGLEFGDRLRATLPVTTTTPSAVAYDYYAPQTRASSQPSRLVVVPAH